MQNDKLLPCPFCGGEAQPTFLCNGRYNQIKCKTPKCIMNVDLPALYGSREEAIEKWNTRKPMERILEQLEEESDFFGGEPMGSLQKAYYCKGIEKAIEIVKGGVDNAG